MSLYISLTSIFGNQHMLFLTLQSILNQTLKFDKCFIYLSEEPYLQDDGFKDREITNENLKFLLNENTDIFEIKWVKNTGPFRKILNLLEQKWHEDCVIIYLDDDVVYEPTLINTMVNIYKIHNCCVNCRGFSFNLDVNWTYRNRLKEVIPRNLYNFATGKGGVLLKPSYFHKTKDIIFDYSLYSELCPYNEDLWMTFLRICNNVDCFVYNYQFFIEELSLPNNRPRSLYDNYNKQLNDTYIHKLLTKLHELDYLKFPNNAQI